MTTIFISYRQSDSRREARWIYETLKDWYEEDDDQVFLDIHSIAPGAEWEPCLEASLAESDVVLAVIGKRWAQGISKRKDYPRREIAQALSMAVPVIPVLVNGARLPSRARLPYGLKTLDRRQAVRLSRANFDEKLTQVWVEVEQIAKGLHSANEVWLLYLLATSELTGRNVAAVRSLSGTVAECRHLSRLSLGKLETLLESLCEQGWLSYTSGEEYYYYWYDPE